MTEQQTKTAKYTLKMLAELRGLTSLEALARAADISPDRLYAINAGRVKEMTAQELLRLSDLTGIDPGLIETDYPARRAE